MIAPLASYLPQDRLRALARGQDLPDRARGAALFADISGFTPLTEQLTQQLGARRGIEELTRRINAVYDALIGEIERYGGSVIGFAGDAMTCWFDDDAVQTLPSCPKLGNSAFSIHHVVRSPRPLPCKRPCAASQSWAIKVAVASGPVRRFVVGDPAIQRLDTLAGATLTRLASAEHLARTGEVIVDAATLAALGDTAQISEWRAEGEERFAVLQRAQPARGASAVAAAGASADARGAAAVGVGRGVRAGAERAGRVPDRAAAGDGAVHELRRAGLRWG